MSMANQISKIEPIPAPDQRLPARPVSLPPWVKVRLDTLKTAEQPDQHGRYRTVRVLPAALLLVRQQRVAIEQHVAVLTALLEQTPERDNAYAGRTLVAVSRLLVTLAGRASGDLAGQARGEAYVAALDDVACWATEEAARLWFRGECGTQHNYTWPPAPAILRSIAQQSHCSVGWRASQLEQLLDAEEEHEFSLEHRASMQARLRALAISLGASSQKSRG
jgi:hypothetical protein